MAELRDVAHSLGFHAIASNWQEYANADWLKGLLEAEQKSGKDEV